MAVSSIKDYRKKYDAKLAEIEQFANSYVLIGFQEGTVTKSQVKGGRRKAAGKVMAKIAAENEFGTKRIPARPFMRTSFDENRQRINNAIAGEYEKILGSASTVKRSLNLLGLFGVDLIQQKIRAIQFPPNSPRTIAIKKSSKPLIDFGQMIQSVRHKVVMPI
jgi:HK97 gp10 family phage protein